MTNLEWIQTMNIDDMIRFLSKVEMNGVVSYYWDARNKKTLREWLCMEYVGEVQDDDQSRSSREDSTEV